MNLSIKTFSIRACLFLGTWAPAYCEGVTVLESNRYENAISKKNKEAWILFNYDQSKDEATLTTGHGNTTKYNVKVRLGQMSRKSPGRLWMQKDGNLCIWTSMASVWCGGSEGSPDSRLVLEENGDLAVKSGAKTLWLNGKRL